RAPSRELRTAFEKFKEWLTQIYATVQKLLGKERLSEDIRQVFDSLLATDRELLFSPRGEDRPALSLPRNELADVMRLGLAPQMKRDLARGMEKALSDLVTGEPVDVGPVLRESEALGRAYDLVREDPLGGPPNEIMAVLSSPEFERILVERGPGKAGDNGEIIVRDKDFVRQFGSKAWGLVKIIWRHGEESKQKYPVTREDIIAMPQVIREYERVNEAERMLKSGESRWVVRDKNGVDTVYVVNRRKKGYQEPTLITVFKDDTGGYGLSNKRNLPTSSAGENPQSRGKSPNYRDTTGGSTAQTPQRQGDEISLPPTRPEVNPAPDFRTEARDTFEPAPKPTPEAETSRLEAADAAIEQRLQEMQEAGLIDEESARTLAESRDELARVEHYDDMGQSIVECIWHAVE
ncbi:MAG: hypothetical protein IJU37_09485, partial [Desulfovibrio sp.]|nr:hypothetical protein [Desulfovibrio sp.]